MSKNYLLISIPALLLVTDSTWPPHIPACYSAAHTFDHPFLFLFFFLADYRISGDRLVFRPNQQIQMSSRKRPRKSQQQRLTFEPVAAAAGPSSPPLHDFGRSPAHVRFSSPRKTQESSPSRKQTASPSSVATMRGKKRKPRQQTLESSLGKFNY